MTRLDDAIAATVDRFQSTELAQMPRIAHPNPSIAGIGTVAARGLASPLLRERLASRGVTPANFQAFLGPDALLADRSWHLALVLSPFKRDVAIWCDRLTPAARATGVVDTLLRIEDEVLGVNTNSYAAAGALDQLLGDARSNRALVLGTGGAARSVAVGVRQWFPAVEVGFVGRSPDRVTAIVEDLGFGSAILDAASFDADVVINATTVGETDDGATLGFDSSRFLRGGTRYFDLNNRTSALQTDALAAGCITMSGVFMQLLTNVLRAELLVPGPRQ